MKFTKIVRWQKLLSRLSLSHFLQRLPSKTVTLFPLRVAQDSLKRIAWSKRPFVPLKEPAIIAANLFFLKEYKEEANACAERKKTIAKIKLPAYLSKNSIMKSTLIITILLATSLKNFSQELAQPKTLSAKETLVQKSKNQKTAGFILLGAGTIAFFGAGLHSANNILEKTPTSDAIAAVGLGAMIGSIPLFIAAKRNKKKAAALSAFLHLDNRQLMASNAIHQIRYPAIGFSLYF